MHPLRRSPCLARVLPPLAAVLLAGCREPARDRLEVRLRGLLEEAARARTLPRSRVHPALLANAHPVQLHRALRWLSSWGGEFQGLAPASFTATERSLGGAKAAGGDATARFARGSVALHLLFVEDRLAHLEVKDALRQGALAAHLAAAPADRETRDLFAEAGKDFWARALMGAEDRAFRMLHAGLQQALPGPEVLRPPPGVPRGEALVEIAYLGARVDPEHAGKLHLLYQVRGEKDEVPAHVTLQFAGLQVHLVGFQLPSQLPPEPATASGGPR